MEYDPHCWHKIARIFGSVSLIPLKKPFNFNCFLLRVPALHTRISYHQLKIQTSRKTIFIDMTSKSWGNRILCAGPLIYPRPLQAEAHCNRNCNYGVITQYWVNRSGHIQHEVKLGWNLQQPPTPHPTPLTEWRSTCWVYTVSTVSSTQSDNEQSPGF